MAADDKDKYRYSIIFDKENIIARQALENIKTIKEKLGLRQGQAILYLLAFNDCDAICSLFEMGMRQIRNAKVSSQQMNKGREENIEENIGTDAFTMEEKKQTLDDFNDFTVPDDFFK